MIKEDPSTSIFEILKSKKLNFPSEKTLKMGEEITELEETVTKSKFKLTFDEIEIFTPEGRMMEELKSPTIEIVISLMVG